MTVLLEGLHRAKDDQKIINDTSFDKNFGPCLYNKYYESFPMFFTRFGKEMDLIGQYHGASIFFICNGPSLASGKYDLTLLKKPGIVTYGINNGPRTIRPNLWSCVDSPERFLKSIWLDPVIAKFVPLTFSEKPIFDNEQWQTSKLRVQDCPNVIYFRRNEKFVANRFLKELTIGWGNHKDAGGGRSVMLAVFKIMFLLGFRNVFLMGADFKMSENYTYHFDEQRAKGAVHGNMDTYQKLANQYFPELKPYFDAEGFNVYNCNPESELKVFDYVSYEDAIAFASSPLGDVDNERTWGMYSKPDERQKWAVEPDNRSKVHLANIPARVKTPIFINTIKPQQNAPIKMPVQAMPVQAMPPNARIVEPPEEAESCRVVAPKSIPMGFNMKTINQPNQPNQLGPNVRIINVKNETQIDLNKNNRIVRSMPCGGGISFGSSGSPGQPNITIDDDGK